MSSKCIKTLCYKNVWVQFSEAPCCRPLQQPFAVSLLTPSPDGNFHGSCHYLPSPRLPGALSPMSGCHQAASAPPFAPPVQLAVPVWHRPLLRRFFGGQQGMTPASAPPMWSRTRSQITDIVLYGQQIFLISRARMDFQDEYGYGYLMKSDFKHTSGSLWQQIRNTSRPEVWLILSLSEFRIQ